MPRYLIKREVDAYANYFAVVEADTPDEALALAELDEEDYDWEFDGINTFDAREFHLSGLADGEEGDA